LLTRDFRAARTVLRVSPNMRASSSTPGGPTRAALAAPFLGLQALLALFVAYLLALLPAARRGEPGAAVTNGGERLRLTVLIPAHDEEAGIDAALTALRCCEYPSERLRTIVVADNCGDGTAARAAAAGAEVWERRDPGRRGKGHALHWACERLEREDRDGDAVVFLDADCQPSPNLLSALERRLAAGAAAVQADYTVANPGESPVAALRFAAFALVNTVRPLAKQRLGLSCGLGGTGMGFTRELLRRHPWDPTHLTEDEDYHLRLVLAGERAEFAPEASVSSAMPTSARASREQQARWEGGKLAVVSRWAPRLLLEGARRRDRRRLHAGFECLLPPQSLIAGGSLASALVALALGRRRLLALSAATLAGQAAFVLVGLRLARAPAGVYRALPRAPWLIVAKLGIYARLLSGRGPRAWVRTEREDRP
jgi:hypothetical protein